MYNNNYYPDKTDFFGLMNSSSGPKLVFFDFEYLNKSKFLDKVTKWETLLYSLLINCSNKKSVLNIVVDSMVGDLEESKGKK
ncbi:hypothetical protein K9M18_02910 [Candidatus Woesearchaeota archaeon]|nr:hypothetical protein [Candidatus Woesearchaeota archaeon]MCF8012861.1 hypothetical protein [Candidatus Woesearchaeota archaeon]